MIYGTCSGIYGTYTTIGTDIFGKAKKYLLILYFPKNIYYLFPQKYLFIIYLPPPKDFYQMRFSLIDFIFKCLSEK